MQISRTYTVQGEATPTTGLVLPVQRTTGLGCIPEGETVSYECTVNDNNGRSTVWQGSAFNCFNNSSWIILNHLEFQHNGASGTCGDLSATSIGVSGDNYTSRLTVTATAGLNGKTIECTINGLVAFGNDTLRTGGE